MLPADALRVIVRTPDVRVRVIARMPAVIRAVHVIARMPTVIRAVHVIARMPTVISAVHVIVRKQKRCCPLVLSEVFTSIAPLRTAVAKAVLHRT